MMRGTTLDKDPPTTTRAIAALPMYDPPRLQAATDAFWSALAKRLEEAGVAAPVALSRADDYTAAWHDPELLFGQACGYPLITRFKDAATIVATPIYGVPGCEGLTHRSFFITSAQSKRRSLGDVGGGVCAINGYDSNTGMNLLRGAIAPLAKGEAFFGSVIVTGAHRASLEAVADGRADLAAIDCVSFAHVQRFEPELTARVAIIGESERTAAPPFITARGTSAAVLLILRQALRDIATAPELASVRSALAIEGFAFETDAHYDRLAGIEADAIAQGYPTLL